MPEFLYRDIDFRPAAVPGWRALWIDNDGRLKSDSIVGWLIQESYVVEDDGEEHPPDKPAADRERRIVAAIHAPGWGAMVTSAATEVDVWCVLGPDQPDPTPEEVAAEHHRRQGGSPE
ncbi:hypothetical protein RB614_13315 [Phytohabitans sp. ZYX-F-186]|uniref:Uncharacterized protein n=1 Tax=Phytohabitans maris TaxID=3071409 RepID=A0ABU0ZEP5_9ACTN|nr:hypothetical protein [Phytohabitans sp. ZYX-F-186]MDQ7905503.1 hypothetical protein [Phytohabitans sp. ZYX-F-186]